jgi:hypothetical protein
MESLKESLERRHGLSTELKKEEKKFKEYFAFYLFSLSDLLKEKESIFFNNPFSKEIDLIEFSKENVKYGVGSLSLQTYLSMLLKRNRIPIKKGIEKTLRDLEDSTFNKSITKETIEYKRKRYRELREDYSVNDAVAILLKEK